METLNQQSSEADSSLPKASPSIDTLTPEQEGEPFKYELFKDTNESTGKWISGEKLRMDYLQLTDNLVHKITEGVEVTDELTGESENRPYSTVVFLDKSARPLSHLVREAWPRFAKNANSNETPPLPEFKFINVDRRQWIDQLDHNWSGIMDINRVDESFIWSLRSAYLTPDGKKQVEETGLTSEIEDMPATLDNKTVLVVDETFYSGDTVKIATGLLRRAFPSAHIDGTHWMNEKVNGMSRNPVWYSEALMGRGVSNRYSELGNYALNNIPDDNFYAKKAGFFISSPHWRKQPGLRDELYYQLVSEIKALVANPDVPIIPSLSRDKNGDDEYIDRIISYNYDVDVTKLDEDEKISMAREVLAKKDLITEASRR